MTRGTLTTAEAAATIHVTAHTIAAWCRTGRITAVKRGRRWAIAPRTVARLLCPTGDRPRTSELKPRQTGRTARRTTGRQLARATSRQYGIPLIGHHQRARIAAANTGHITARDYLFDLGCDVEFVEEYESAFGRKTAATYRTNRHAEPDTRGLVILHGRLWHVARYTDIRDLHAGARAYPRTADLFELVA